MIAKIATERIAAAVPGDVAAGFPPETWTTTHPCPRVVHIKQRLLTTPRWIDIERARLSTEAYRATAGQPIALIARCCRAWG